MDKQELILFGLHNIPIVIGDYAGYPRWFMVSPSVRKRCLYKINGRYGRKFNKASNDDTPNG